MKKFSYEPIKDLEAAEQVSFRRPHEASASKKFAKIAGTCLAGAAACMLLYDASGANSQQLLSPQFAGAAMTASSVISPASLLRGGATQKSLQAARASPSVLAYAQNQGVDYESVSQQQLYESTTTPLLDVEEDQGYSATLAGVVLAAAAATYAVNKKGKEIKEYLGIQQKPKLAMLAVTSLPSPEVVFKPVLDAHPIDLMGKFKPMDVDPWKTEKLSDEQKATLTANIELVRDYIIFFTGCGSASGYGGHTGGAYDTVPEMLLMEAMMNACPDKFHHAHFDEAGHRAGTQYVLSVLHGDLDQNHTPNYRVGHSKLPGHPELGYTKGVKFSSGRLGHMWGHVNGVALQDKTKSVFMLGSDGSQMEGNDAESARMAVAQNLNTKLFIDDNDVTIAGHPSDYMKGFSVAKTLEGAGLKVQTINPENVDELYAAMRDSVMTEGPVAVICKRPMAVGIKEIEGECHGHDAIAVKYALSHFEGKGMTECVEALQKVQKTADPQSEYLGSSNNREANRRRFGAAVADILKGMTAEERDASVRIIDCDLEGSTGLATIREAAPEVFFNGGIMERGNYEACAGFGSEAGKQGIFSTFAAFQEMIISEITMARLNNCNVLSHFSHSGSDDMADNTCHFGINNMFADNGIEEIDAHSPTMLYFPVDAHQMEACVKKVYHMPGQRFIYSTRSACPFILDEDGNEIFKDKEFQVGKDDLIREGKDGYVVAYGDALYRALDAVEKLRAAGQDVGLINKSTLNTVDEEMMKKIGATKFCLVVEPMSSKNGLGMRFGTWLLKGGNGVKYDNIGVSKEGSGGLWEHAYHQGYDSVSVYNKCAEMINSL